MRVLISLAFGYIFIFPGGGGVAVEEPTTKAPSDSFEIIRLIRKCASRPFVLGPLAFIYPTTLYCTGERVNA